RLAPHMRLAAEAAADLGSGDTQLAGIHAEELRAGIAIDEVALRADPHFALAVGADARQARMRLDIALMRLLSPEGALDDDVGLLEAGVDVTMAEFRPLGDIGSLLRLRLDAFGEHVGMEQ